MIVNITNHILTEDQKYEIASKFQCQIWDIVDLTEDLKKRWANICPESEIDVQLIAQLVVYCKNATAVIVQGESGHSYRLVTKLMGKRIPCLHACSKRVSVEIEKDGRVEKKSVFKHVQFRNY